MFSALFTASPAASSLVSIVSGFVFLVSSTILPSLKNTENDFYAGSTPSRTSGTPSLVVLQQNGHGSFIKSLLIIICFTATLASGSWARSPRSGRLKREGNAPPPPPPPPLPSAPQQIPLGDLNDDDGTDTHAGNGDDGEEDPDQEGDGYEQTEQDGDGHQVAAAPAPEDPPPPGGLEDEEGDNHLPFDGLLWLALLIVASGLFAIIRRLWSNRSHKSSNLKPSAKIPGPLERQMVVAQDFTSGASKAPSIVQGFHRAQPILLSATHLYTTVSPTLPAASSPASVARTAWRIFAWRKAYILLAVVPGLGVLAAIIRLLTLQNRHRIPEIVAERPALAPEPVTPRNRRLIPPPTTPRRPRRLRVARLEPIAWPAPESDDHPLPGRHLEPRAPPPSPVSPQRHRPLPPLPLRDPATQAVCQNMLTLIEQKTALRMARAQEDVEANESTKRVREVQRRIWGLLCELYEEGAGAEEV